MTTSTIKPLKAEILDVRGECSAGHKKGDTLTVSCYDSGGLCGFFYHDIFPSLSVMQFGGKYPWAPQDKLVIECVDKQNAVTLKITREE
ncbi:MAG: TIGR04076 family protein [Desulfobacteraceae bacterium]|nr:TIGR04076 family protein [Desulfobacteraceae bacterium]